jgi:hypothetical protein
MLMFYGAKLVLAKTKTKTKTKTKKPIHRYYPGLVQE